LQADAVVGCFSLLQGCYLLLVTKKRLHGSVCGEGPIFFRLTTARMSQAVLANDVLLEQLEPGLSRLFTRPDMQCYAGRKVYGIAKSQLITISEGKNGQVTDL